MTPSPVPLHQGLGESYVSSEIGGTVNGIVACIIATALVVASLACGLVPVGQSDPAVAPTLSNVATPTPSPAIPTATSSSSPTPAPTATPAPTPVPTPTPVEGPGYGGHFLDPEENVVYVYLVNPSPEAVREVTITHLAPLVYKGTKKIREVRPLQAKYTLRQLHRWYDQLRDAGIWGITGMTTSDVDEGINRLEYGIDCERNRDRVRQQIDDLLTRENVPLEAVVVEVKGRPITSGPFPFECAPPEVVDPGTGVSSPGFGGLFWDSNYPYRTLSVYMLEPSQQKAEDLALQVVGRESLDRVSTVRALKAQYTWEQLLEWYELVRVAGLDVPGADLIAAFMEDRNRLVVEIDQERNPDVETEVEDVLKKLGIPLDAVVMLEW